MNVMESQITSVLVIYSTVCPAADQSKRQSSPSLALWGEFTVDWWISCTKAKCFHLMNSLCIISIYVPFSLQAQSSQVLLVVPSSQMETPINNKKAKALLFMGSMQLVIGILEVVFNIGANVMWVVVSSYVGPGYWCGLFVSFCCLL